jgi:3-methyladenine DNA glycosylase AlkD
MRSTAAILKRETTELAAEIRRTLAARGSNMVAVSAQRFFKEVIQAHGWRTAPLRKFAHEQRKLVQKSSGIAAVVELADELFRGEIIEEKTFAVLLLEQSAAKLSDHDFRLFEQWLDRVSNWGDHDGVVMYLIGPMMLARPDRVRCVRQWARSPNLWKRRAAAVSLIRGLRRGRFWREAQQIARFLLDDEALMVQKGVGWMLREAAKADPERTVPFLISIRECASRLVVRTACEALPAKGRLRLLRSSDL